MGKLSRMILGERMPDRDDPKYRARYEKDVEAGRRFARATGVDRLAGRVQLFAERHSALFLGIVLAIVFGCLLINISHFSRALRIRRDYLDRGGPGVEQVVPDTAHSTTPIQDTEDETDEET